MSVKVIFECSGCEAKIEGTAPLRARFESMYGGNLCRIIKPTAEDVVPEGWVAYDPYTLATYCPECCEWDDEKDELVAKVAIANPGTPLAALATPPTEGGGE